MKKMRFIIPLISFVVVIVLLRFVFYIGYVSTESMEPTILAGSKVIGIRIIKDLSVGDIIVFEYNDTNMVKRIAAEPGEKISNNLVVPEDCYYVLGDNTNNSYDSRYWPEPFVHRNKIKARIIFR